MNESRQLRNLALGTAGASVAPALGLAVYSAALEGFWPASLDDLIGVIVFLAVATAASLAGFVAFGLPYVTWLRRRSRLSWLNVCIGAALGGAVFLVLFGWLGSWNNELPGLKVAGSGALLGLLAGVGFCLGAGPNNSSKPMPLRGTA